MGAFDGKVAIITGGSAGVGRATAQALAREGAAVGLIARGQEALDATVAEITAAGGRALALPADVTDEKAVEGAVARLVSEFGGLDIVIANAGAGHNGKVDDTSLVDWNRVLGVTLTGPFLIARAALSHLRARGGGQIVAVSSGAGKRGYAGMAAYCAAKFGLQGFMESLAEEVGGDGIRVGTIVPGSIMTGFGGRSVDAKRDSGSKYLHPEDVADAILYQLRQPVNARIQEMLLWPN